MAHNVFAAVDIGSNAIRFLANTILDLPEGPIFQKTAYLRVPLRLGEDVFTTGRIGNAKMEQLARTMNGFLSLMRAYGVSRYHACATSAVRDAENGEAAIRLIKENCGMAVTILSGQEEADIIYDSGAFDKIVYTEKNCLYMDVGGGSVEIVVYANRRKVNSCSFRLGAVRSLVGAVTDMDREAFCREMAAIHKNHAPQKLIAFGGNINKVYKLLGKKKTPLVPEELAALYITLKNLSFEERMQCFSLNEYRADVIVPALEIFLLLLDFCPSAQKIYVPQVGLADGLIHRLYKNPESGQAVYL